MGKSLRFTASLQPRGPAAAIVLTDDQVAALAGGAKTPPVKVTVNGTYTFDGRVGRMGGENLLGFNKAVRAAAGVEAGDTVDVIIVADIAERAVAIPEDLTIALTDAGVSDMFVALAPSHRKEYVRWITEAKRPETRSKRIAETVAKIGKGAPSR